MSTPEVIEHIIAEPEFKEICDRILRTEVSPLVQLYGGKGGDGGVDADYEGTFDGVTGRWVFQYKFVSPVTDRKRARTTLLGYFGTKKKTKSKKTYEFDKDGVQGVSGYVLLTNVHITVPCHKQITQWFTEKHSKAKFCIWGPAAINSILVQHPEMARSRGQKMENLCRNEVIKPLWDWVEHSLKQCRKWAEHYDDNPMWPVRFVNKEIPVPKSDLAHQFTKDHHFTLFHDDPLFEETKDRSRTPRIDHRALEQALACYFPRSLQRLEQVRTELQRTSELIQAKVHELNTEIQSRYNWQHFPQHVFLDLAFTLLSSAWGYCSGIQINDRQIAVGARMIYTGDAKHTKEPLQTLCNEAQEKYQRGKNLPADVTEARQRLYEAIAALASDLWHPAKIGMDAPKPEPEPD